MLFELPNPKILYQAMLDQNEQYDGRAYVCVKTTGIFCRLICPARNPKFENCHFFETVVECLDAGYRPCRRCQPLLPAGQQALADNNIAVLLQALEREPGKRWYEADIVQLGLDPSSVRRSFKRQYGITFLEMARQARLREAFNTLSEGSRVVDAQVGAGFESASAFRAAFARLLGATPSGFSNEANLQASWFDTPLGAMIAVSDQRRLHLLEFSDRKALPSELRRLCGAGRGVGRGVGRSIGSGQELSVGFGKPPPSEQAESELQDFFSLKSDSFKVPLAFHGTAFTQSVWRELQTIPAGQTRSYTELAHAVGRPAAVRAVARANGANQIAVIVPCHRVIGADGSLTGYGGGLWRKQKLIDLERRYL